MVISPALYELFCRLFQEDETGAPPAERVLAAQATAGRLSFLALRYVGEHRVSLRDYALALLRADRDSFGGRCRGALAHALETRGLIDPGECLEADLDRVTATVPKFRLEPAVTDAGQVLALVDDWERSRIAEAVAEERWIVVNKRDVLAVWGPA